MVHAWDDEEISGPGPEPRGTEFCPAKRSPISPHGSNSTGGSVELQTFTVAMKATGLRPFPWARQIGPNGRSFEPRPASPCAMKTRCAALRSNSHGLVHCECKYSKYPTKPMHSGTP